ncbi:TIGR00303 family protein [Oscillatoria sp. FACHB-1407]|uniref:nicotinate mononucleotide-dependent phosphoribosyltransferase CobT n=1 Tax=Oscillatoria sp. FACHB-1407 TaxID=2692847 RepID=UPI0016863DD1|nr:TIGR00303 family protein [Oscillatoria sp. FACHB-1407]MBD2464098.1 TIGR00303 family protein [Oscillatoria sp. FACHB-1407]
MTTKIYTQPDLSQAWIERFQGQDAVFACVLGFTETGLLPGISAAGATPTDRQFTAIADAEFLYNGPQAHPQYPLPPLMAGASPTLISRAVVEGHALPTYIFNAGLRHAPTVPTIDLGGMPARCVSEGHALDLEIVHHLLQQGLMWGEKLAGQVPQGYLILGECVVGGTTTALALLTGLGWDATGKVNSSHPSCNHAQKWDIVQSGLARSPLLKSGVTSDPLKVVAAVGDPMQIVVAGMAIAASRTVGVLLAGGTQMLAVYALIQAIATTQNLSWDSHQVIVGTTRWVADDPTGDTVGLANLLNAPLIATNLSFANSRYAQLRAYEQGYVKEGVGAGGCAIASHLKGWSQPDLLYAIEALADRKLKLEQD